jgi:hypothetical protein
MEAQVRNVEYLHKPPTTFYLSQRMGTTYGYIVLVCTVVAIAAEVTTLLFPRTLLRIVSGDIDKMPSGPLPRILGIMSFIYMVDIALLLFSGDAVFRIYAVILMVLAFALWLTRKHIVDRHYVLMLESAVCLTILLDVARTVARATGLIPQ